MARSSIGSCRRLDTGLPHDWAGGDFLPSQIVEAVGLAIGITSLVTFAVANITPAQAPAIAATIQVARLLGIEVGTAFIQTFVQVCEQVYSNLIGQHLSSASDVADRIVTTLSDVFSTRANNLGIAASQVVAAAGRLVQREALCSPISTGSGSSPGCSSPRPCSCCCCAGRRRTP